MSAPRLVAILAVVIGLVRIISTHTIFSPTYDEPAHLATGMELLSEGRYEYEPQHPPLARVAAAALPYAAGLRTIGIESFWTEGHTLIHGTPGKSYKEVTRLARLGMLPFFVLVCWVAWLWGRRLRGDWAGAVAVFLISALPVVLAHAGLAATDIAATATFPLALYALTAMVETPGRRTALLAGGATALAVLSKLTALLFIPAACAATLAVFLVRVPRGERKLWLRNLMRVSVLVPAVAAFAVVLWAGYGFSLGSLADPADRPYESINERLGDGTLAKLAIAAIEAPVIPAVELLHGIRQVMGHHEFGHRSFLLGEVRSDGWLHFFPVAVLVKNPIPFLMLTGLGIWWLVRNVSADRRRIWGLVAIGAATMIVVVSMPSRINIGFRHIMPILPMLAAVAALGAVTAWESARTSTVRGGIVALFLLFAISSVRAHPDYLSYFNILAGRNPDRVLPFSDLDWGQDLTRLADELRSRGVDSLTLGTGVDIPFHFLESSVGLPSLTPMPPLQPVYGWVAVDVYNLRMGSMFDLAVPIHAYNWVERFEPVVKVGETFRLYYFSPDSASVVESALAAHRAEHGDRSER
jgi:hypothetical protein